MADTDTETLPNGTGTQSEDDERMKQRPADIDADVREMERRKRVEALMSSKLFREELERVLDQQMHEGADAPLLQRIKEMVGGRLHTGSFRGPSCVLPINDIRGIEGVGYEKGEKILRCKLAALYRLVDLFGWTQCGVASQLTARLNTAVEQLLISPRGLMPHEVTASSLLKVDMQGTVIDSGTTNYGVHKSGFSVHAAVHAARPDVRCVLHLRSPPVLAISATKQGLLPLCTEAALIGEVAYHRVPTGILDNEERDKIVRVLGPSCKILFLRSQGALCCGSTLEEAFYHAKHLHTAADVQLKLATVPRDQLAVMDDEERKEVYDASRAEGAAESSKWRAGGEEFEALMRMLDNAGFRTGYIYRNPLVKNDVPRPKNDVEVPPAVSSLGYLLEEEEMYRLGIWKKGQGKTGERTRWLNSPNVYQKVEVLETGTNDPKKITKWVDSHNEEWVTDGSPGHSSTPMKIDAALQFVPKNTNPKEFRALQQQIKDNRRADKISAGPQSHILEGVTWDEANRLNAEDASATHAGDHVVLVGAASKGIIQRGYQHNATVYSAPYARNPFEHVSERDLDEYTRRVTGQGNYDTDLSESEAISAAQMTSPVSETETESRDEHRVLRIETKQAPMRSQPEVVLSDDATDFLNAERSHVDRTRGNAQNPELTRSPNPSTANKKRDYPRCPNFESLILKYDTPKSDPKCKVNLKKRYDSEPTHADAVEIYNPGCLSSRGSLNSVPSIEWDVKKTDNFRSQSLPRKLCKKFQQQRYYRSCSHAGFINQFIKNPEPIHYHVPKCRKCGSFNSSYDWEITKRDLKSLGQSSIWHSYENIHKSCLREGDRKVLAICDVVRVKEIDAPVFDVNTEFIDSEEYNEDCYLENTYLSSSTVVENAGLNLVDADAVVVDGNVNANMLDSGEKATAYTENNVKNADVTCLDIASEEYKRVDQHNINQDVVKDIKSGQGVHENGVYRAECVYTETSDDSDKADRCKSSNNSPESNIINTDTDDETIQDLPMGIEDIAIDKQVEGSKVNAEISAISKCGNLGMNENENPSYVDSSVYRVFRAVLKELKSKLSTLGINDLLEKQIDFTVDNVEGEYLNFSNELDFDRAVYDSPVINLITKDVRDFLVPLNFYSVNDSPSKYNTSVGKALETIVEETKVSDSSNDSVKDSSGEKDIDRNNIDIKVAFAIPNSNDDSENTGKARTELYINLEDNNPSMKDCLDIVHNVQEDKEIELPERKNSVADLSCLEVCENFKISIESSSNEIPSFDSTAEFEKIEAVADVLSILIKRVSITIVNKDENDFYATVDQALKVKHKGVKFFDLREIEQDFIAGKNQEVELYLEPEAEQTSTDRYDINDDQAEQPVILNDENENRCKEEIFSIVEIVKNIDQETVGQNLTVLSEDSDLDPKTHPFKVCESIVYHIFCTMYCKIKQKDKRDNGNSKAVVTVVDIEDIMFTALPIWDIALINEMPVDIEEAGEKCKPTVDAETSEHGASCNSSEVIMEDNQMSIENVLLLSNDNENKDEIEGKEADYDMYLEFDLKDKVNVEEVNVHISSHCEQEGLVAVQSKIVDMNVETIAAEEVLTKVALPEGNAMRNDALELQKEKPDENSECLMVHKNYNVSEDTAYSLINDIINNFDDNTVNAEGGVIVSIVNSAVKEDDCLFPQAEETVYSETLSEASDTASTLTQDTTFNSCELESNVAASEVNFNKEELESVKNEDCYTQSEGFTENRYIGYAQVASDSPEGLTQPHTKIHALKDLIIDSDDIQTENLVKNLDLIDITQSAQKLEEEINLNISSVLVGNEQEDAIKENELVAVEEINRIVLNITDSLDKCKGANVTRSNSHTIEDQDVIKETTLIAVEEIPQIILSVPDCIDECDQDNAVTADSELPIRVTVTEIKSLELPVSNLNPNAAAFVMKFCEYAETTNIEIHENDIDLNVSVIVKQDVFDILDDVLEVVSSMHERYSNENTYSVSPVESNESVEGLCVDELNFASTNKSSVTEIGAIEDEEDKEAFKILAIDVRKSLKEIRLSHTSNRDETTGSSDDDPIVLDVYDTKSYGKDKENKYEYGEYYDDSSNGSNKDNGELYIEKHGTPKFVDLVARDEDGSIDSITYNSHILQSLVENLLQDVISEFVIDDNVSEIINTEVTQDPKVADGVDRSGTNFDINKNETFVLDSNNLNIEIQNTTADSALCEISDGDMAYESCSKTDLDQTYVLGTEPAKDNSELTEDVSYFDTAFCEDTMLTNQSSPYKNNSPIFTSCDESPIKNPNTAYLDDSMLYDKCDEISPFDKTVAVQSMSQGVNSGGIKYWVSFDDSFTEIDDKVKSNRGKKNRDIPTFYSFDTVDDLPVRGSSNYDSNVFKHKTSDSSVYMTASCSKSKNDAWTSCHLKPSTSKADENERRLLFDCSKRSKKQFDCGKRSKRGGRRREYDTWPPYDESLFYRIISNFRMSESFDMSDLENVNYR